MNRSNTGRCFLDANVWLYAFIESQDRKKSGIAKQIIQNKETFVSGQVINEVSINLIRKARFDEARIRRLIISFYRNYHVVESGRELLLKACALRSNYAFSFWDSMIVASSLAAGATTLYTEDMHDGLVVDDRLTILNPFHS